MKMIEFAKIVEIALEHTMNFVFILLNVYLMANLI